ncbi:MAG: hypothetical protein AAFX87_04400 [Bacteroidota bacterium]
MTQIRIFSLTFFIVAIGLGVYLYMSVKGTIDEKARIEAVEDEVIEKLELIREAEIVYQEVHGNYTSDWDKLKDFINNGVYYVIERSETIITLSYGADSIIVDVDTIGTISARERIFKKTHTAEAADDGIFDGYLVSMEDKAIKNRKAYALVSNGRRFEHPFRDNGRITSIENVQPGDNVTKGQILITFWEYKFDPKIDIDRLEYIPGSTENKKFDIYAAEIEKNNILVDVIEVRDTDPVNPERRKKRTDEDKKKSNQPLGFGSRYDVTTSGNWE